jgi:hypothetical protein
MRPQISKNVVFAALTGLALIGGIRASRAQVVYVTTSLQAFGTVDLATGLYTDQNPGTAATIGSLTVLPNGDLYGMNVPRPANNLNSTLYKIDPFSGGLTVLAATNQQLTGLAAAPGSGALFVSDQNSTLFSMTNTGITTQIGAAGPAASFDLGALAFGPFGNLYQLQKSAGTDNIFLRDTSNGGALQVNVGPTPLTRARALVSANGLLFAFDDTTAHNNEIFVFNPFTGIVSDTGLFAHLAGGQAIPGFIDASTNPLRAVPEPGAMALLTGSLVAGAGFMVRRRRRK